MRPKPKIFDIIVDVISLFPVISIIVVYTIIAVIISFNHRNGKPKLETWCANVEYYNYKSHTIENFYTQVTLLESNIRSIKLQNGSKLYSKDFISDTVLDEKLIVEPKLKDGSYYKVTLLTNHQCYKKSVMDTLLKHNDDDEEPDIDD